MLLLLWHSTSKYGSTRIEPWVGVEFLRNETEDETGELGYDAKSNFLQFMVFDVTNF